jgi:hypothetical protein
VTRNSSSWCHFPGAPISVPWKREISLIQRYPLLKTSFLLAT